MYEIIQRKEFDVIKCVETVHISSDISYLLTPVRNSIKNDRNIAFIFNSDSYLSSRTGSVIIQSWELCRDEGLRFAIVSPNKNITDFLAIVDMESSIEIYQVIEELD